MADIYKRLRQLFENLDPPVRQGRGRKHWAVVALEDLEATRGKQDKEQVLAETRMAVLHLDAFGVMPDHLAGSMRQEIEAFRNALVGEACAIQTASQINDRQALVMEVSRQLMIDQRDLPKTMIPLATALADYLVRDYEEIHGKLARGAVDPRADTL